MRKTLAGLASITLALGLAAGTPANAGRPAAKPHVATIAELEAYEKLMRDNGTEGRVLAQAAAEDRRQNEAGASKGKGPVHPLPPARSLKRASCGSPSICYEYNGFDQVFTADPADSTSATLTIGKPYVDNSVLNGAHSLGEVAVESALTSGTFDRVEFGWTVDKILRPDGNPILWAGHTIDGVFKGYNTAYVDFASNPVNLGAGLPKPVDKSFNVAQTTTAFWVMYDGQWVAYVPKSRWTPGGVVRPFNATSAAFDRIIWFYESASHETQTCNDLATGQIYNATGTPTPPVGVLNTYAVGGTTITPNWSVVGSTPAIAAWGTNKISATSGTGGGPGYDAAGAAAGGAGIC